MKDAFITLPFKRVEDLKNCTTTATQPGNAGANDYLRGMANGLILAKAILDGAEPEYIISVESDGTVNRLVCSPDNS